MVICRGKSPGTAASTAIDRLELGSDRASIVAIPVEKESPFEEYKDRLLTEEEARKLLFLVDIQAVIG